MRQGDPLEDTAASDTGDPAEQSELRGRLLAALESLPPSQREVVLLHDLEGWRHREIADLLGTSEGAVRVRLHEARRRLRAALGEKEGG